MQDGWHFQCPKCGLGDREIGKLAADNEVHCEVCLHEDGLTIRLERWQAEVTRACEEVMPLAGSGMCLRRA